LEAGWTVVVLVKIQLSVNREAILETEGINRSSDRM